MILEIISIFLGILLIGTANHESGVVDWHMFRNMIDIVSLLAILVFTAPALLRDGVWKDFKRAFKLLRKDYTCHLSELRRTLDVVEMVQKQVIYAGVISLLMAVIDILRILSDFSKLGPYLAVAILAVLYAMIFEMLLLPLQLEVKRRIIDYMGEDTEAESEKAEAGKKSENTTVGEEKESVTAGGEIEDITVVEKEAGTEEERI